MVSIIIVNYKVKQQLFACIQSIVDSSPKTSYEIIVVDNDEKKIIHHDLQRKFSVVKYIPNENKGFGQGNNRGAQEAQGEYLFFLNPDTKIFSHTIDKLVAFLQKNKNAAAVSPLLHDMKGKVYQQGSLELTPFHSLFTLSFLNKLWPNNPVSKKYYLSAWNKKTVKEVDVVPGTAFLIRKEIFKKVGGFDEKFFLFFEEFDLCKRIKKLGYKLFITPESNVNHFWGASTGKKENIQEIFNKSRFYYFRKHFGLMPAFFTECILRFNKYTALLMLIIAFGTFLRIYNIPETMSFSGDQGWFYISARDMVLTGNTPLVGIPSSHPWLHQGAFWTYLLAINFFLFGFSPYGGGYLSGLIDIVALLVLYKLGELLISRQLGIIAALLYAASPIIVINARVPYHTSPISLFTILAVLFVVKWIKGQPKYFPWLVMMLAILYNFELVTFLISGVVGLIFLIGLVKKQEWALKTIKKKTVLQSIIAFLIPMLPMLIYDISHGFPQTLKFLAWLGYRVLLFFGYPPINPFLSATPNDMMLYFYRYIEQLLFVGNAQVALGIVFAAGLFYVVQFMRKKLDIIFFLPVILVGFLAGCIYLTKTPSEAYLHMIYPLSVIVIAIFINSLFFYRYMKFILISLLVIYAGFNIQFLIRQNFSFEEMPGTVPVRMEIVQYLMKEAQGKEYNLYVETRWNQSEDYAKNYAYLAWLHGHGPSVEKQPLRFVVEEKSSVIKVRKEFDK